MILDLWHEFSGLMDRQEKGQVGDSSFALSCRLLRKRLANARDVNLFACVRHRVGRPLDSSGLDLVSRSTAEVCQRKIGSLEWDSRLERQMERLCTPIVTILVTTGRRLGFQAASNQDSKSITVC